MKGCTAGTTNSCYNVLSRAPKEGTRPPTACSYDAARNGGNIWPLCPLQPLLSNHSRDHWDIPSITAIRALAREKLDQT